MRQQILEKATSMFGKFGVKNVTMDDLAKEMGVSKKTIYQNYLSKNELIEAFIDFITESVNGKLEQVSEMKVSPIEKHFIMGDFGKELFGLNLKAILAYEFNKYYPDIARKMEESRKKRLFVFMDKSLNDGIDRGYYRQNIDVEFLKKFFFSSTVSLLNNLDMICDEQEVSVFDLEIKFLEYFIRGIVTSKGLEELERILKKKRDEVND